MYKSHRLNFKSGMADAHWIWTGERAKNAYVGFAKRFRLSAAPRQARLRVAADTLYKLYVNGRFVNAGPAPSRAPLAKMDEYDIAPFLARGENSIFLLCLFIGLDVKFRLKGEPGVAVAVDLKLRSGASLSLRSDASWEAHPLTCWGAAKETWRETLPRRTWALGYVETVDLGDATYQVLARYAGEDYECSSAVRLDVRSLACTPAVSPAPPTYVARGVPLLAWKIFPARHVLAMHRVSPEVYLLQNAAQRLDHERLHPVYDVEKQRILDAPILRLERRPGEPGFAVLYDLLNVTAGDISLCVECDAPATVDVVFSENLFAGRPQAARDGSHFYFRLRLRAGMNRFRTFFGGGFRYIYVVLKDFEGSLALPALQVHESCAALDWRDAFRTGDRELNAIHAISLRSIALNTQAACHDCNTREMGAYWGDILWVSDCVGHITGNFAHMRQACLDMIPEVAATGLPQANLYGFGPVLFDYALMPLLLLRRYYNYTADSEVIAACADSCRNILGHFDELVGSKGLLDLSRSRLWREDETGQNVAFLDHPGLGWNNTTTRPIYRGSVNAGLQLFYLLALESLRGLPTQLLPAAKLDRRILHLRQAVRRAFWVAEDGLISDGPRLSPGWKCYSQIANALAVMAGVLEGTEARRALELVARPDRHPHIAQGTPYSYFYLAEAMSASGLVPLALETVRREWSVMLENGATTTWETFTGDNADSFNHAWSAVLPYLARRGLLGLRPVKPGYSVLALRPCLEALDETVVQCRLPQGTLKAEWRRVSIRSCEFKIALPPRVTGLIELPGRAPRRFTGRCEAIVFFTKDSGAGSKVRRQRGSTPRHRRWRF